MNALVRLLKRLFQVADDYQRLMDPTVQHRCRCIHPLMLNRDLYCSLCGKPRKWWWTAR